MKLIVAKLVCGIQVVKRLCKKGGKLKQIRKFFRGSIMPFLCPKSSIFTRCVQLLNAKIYPNKFLERDREVKNPADVKGSEAEDSSLESSHDIEPYDAYPSQSDEEDGANLRTDVPAEAYEYVDAICAFYKSEEKSMCIKPNDIARLKLDFDEKLRACIVEWLIEAHKVFEFPTEALYLAINLFDRFLAVHPVEKKQVSLVGVTALQLAVKYAGTRGSIPCVDLVSDLAFSSCPVEEISCSVEEIIQMEDLILNTLQYDLSIPTPSTFMWKFLKETQSDDKIKNLSFFFIDLCLVQHEMLKFCPSVLVAAAIYTAHATFKGCKPCSKIYEQLTGCSAQHILECSRLMVPFHQKARSVKSVYKKYRTRRYAW
ncbi:AMP-binding domain-containing protein [Psidium guajava]|nr:AMP-binding domain-containing protein [Psidium guajava]